MTITSELEDFRRLSEYEEKVCAGMIHLMQTSGIE
jgi:hypothetical protein